MSKTNGQGLTTSQQELLLVWTGHMEATIAQANEYESLVTMGFAVRDVHPVTLDITYRATPAGTIVGHTIAALHQAAEPVREARLEAEKFSKYRIRTEDFKAFSQVLFFALHANGNSDHALARLTDLSFDDINHLQKLCEDFEKYEAHFASQEPEAQEVTQ